jgi:hypothetical protein
MSGLNPNPIGFIPPGDENAVAAEGEFRRFQQDLGIGPVSAPASPLSDGGFSQPSDGAGASQDLKGLNARMLPEEDGGVDGLQNVRSTKRPDTYDPFETDSSLYSSAMTNIRDELSSASVAASADSTRSNTSWFLERINQDINVEAADKLDDDPLPVDPLPVAAEPDAASLMVTIDENIAELENEGPSEGRFAEAYKSVISEADHNLIQTLCHLVNTGANTTRVVGKFLVFLSRNLYRFIEFATRSKLNLFIVLSICGILRTNSPVMKKLFDFLISHSGVALRWFGEITGFNDAVISFFTWLKDSIGITDLITLMEQIMNMIPDAIARASEAAAKAGAEAAGGLAANVIKDAAAEIVSNIASSNAAAAAANAAAAQGGEGLLGGLLNGAGRAAGNTGLTLLVEGLVGMAVRGQQLPRIGVGGRKKRRRTMRHKKRSQTKRRVKHGKRRQTKKRQNKRTKTRSKQ